MHNTCNAQPTQSWVGGDASAASGVRSTHLGLCQRGAHRALQAALVQPVLQLVSLIPQTLRRLHSDGGSGWRVEGRLEAGRQANQASNANQQQMLARGRAACCLAGWQTAAPGRPQPPSPPRAHPPPATRGAAPTRIASSANCLNSSFSWRSL